MYVIICTALFVLVKHCYFVVLITVSSDVLQWTISYYTVLEQPRASQTGTRLCPDTQYRVSIYLQSQALSLSASSRAFYWWLSCGRTVLNHRMYGQSWASGTAGVLSKTYMHTNTYTHCQCKANCPGICFLITLRTAGLGDGPGVLVLCCGLLSSITGKQEMYSWESVECGVLPGFCCTSFFFSNIDVPVHVERH